MIFRMDGSLGPARVPRSADSPSDPVGVGCQRQPQLRPMKGMSGIEAGKAMKANSRRSRYATPTLLSFSFSLLPGVLRLSML